MFTKLYVIALPVCVALDAMWLGVISNSFYKNQIGFLMKSNINWVAAILFYIVFVFGLVLFVILPAIESGSVAQALIRGALFGFIAYAAYDLTNLATLKDWPLLVSIVDMAWGATLAGLVSVVTYFIAGKI